MLLCIWTSLHLNVPEHRKEHLQKYHKLGWMVLGLLAPELVVWNAWEQRKRVKQLNARMKEIGFMLKEPKAPGRVSRWFNRASQKIRAPLTPDNEDPHELADLMSSRGRNNRLNDWTDVHSWLVVMGGLVFEDRSSEDRHFMPGNRTRCHITSEMIAWMAEFRPHLVPDISREYIEDKSKSDWLAKGLACWQAGYFCIQCTFRLSQQLSITLLELNVFAHAICALLLFLVWWDKPRDVLVPTSISSEEALDICAANLYSEITVADARGTKYFLIPIFTLQSPDEYFEIVQPTTIIVRRHIESGTLMVLSGLTNYQFLKIRDSYWQLRDDVPLMYGTISAVLRGEGHYKSPIAVGFTGRDISRLERLYGYSAQCWLTNGGTLISGTSVAPLSKYKISDWSLRSDQIDNIFDIGLQSGHVRTIAGITFASACYGGLHLIAWTSAFPSHAALVMWRAASVTMLATGPFCVAISAYLEVIEWFLPKEDRPDSALEWFFVLSILLACVWYTLCRTFIVVESFILLAHIPESALRVPTWAAYIPSFG